MTLRLRASVALLLALALAGGSARADDKSAASLEAARRRLRVRDVAGGMKALAEAIVADPGDAEAQILYQDVLRRTQPPATLAQQYATKLAAAPDDPLVAYLATRLEKPEDAAKDFASQSSKFANSPWPHEGRAEAFALLGKFKEAGEEHDAAVSAGPREPVFRVAQARTFERANDWGQAAEVWKLALGLRPADRNLMLGLGEALRRSGQPDEAVAQFEKAAALDPTDAEPAYRIGLCRHDVGKFDDALKSFDAAIAKDKGAVEVHCAAVRSALARAAANIAAAKRAAVESDFSPAIAYGTQAIQVCQADTTGPMAHVALGNAEEAAAETLPSHTDAADREYDAAITLSSATSPERIRALNGKAYVCLLAGRWDEALAAADKAIAQEPSNPVGYLHAGRALMGKSLHEDAIKKYYVPGLKVAPDNPRLRHARGVALMDAQKFNDAKKDLEAAVAAEPRNGRFQLSLGELYYVLKMAKQSTAAFVVATDERPTDPVAWRGLGRASSLLKDWEGAAAAYEQVVTLVENPGSANQKPADPAAPPGGAPANPDPAKPDPAKPDPTKPADPNAPPPADPAAKPPAPSMETKLATNEHLYLTLIYADHLKDREKAKAHARKYKEQGGTNPDLDSWIQNLLEEK